MKFILLLLLFFQGAVFSKETTIEYDPTDPESCFQHFSSIPEYSNDLESVRKGCQDSINLMIPILQSNEPRCVKFIKILEGVDKYDPELVPVFLEAIAEDEKLFIDMSPCNSGSE